MENDGRKANAIAKCVLILCIYLVLVGTLSFVFFRSQYRLVPSNEYCRCENLDETNETYRIVNGTSNKALERGLPWLSFVFYKKKVENTVQARVFCTSTVIGRSWVLTGKESESSVFFFVPQIVWIGSF